MNDIPNITKILNKAKIEVSSDDKGEITLISPNCAYQKAATEALADAIGVEDIVNPNQPNGLSGGFPGFEYKCTIDKQYNESLQELDESPDRLPVFEKEFAILLPKRSVVRAKQILDNYGSCPAWSKQETDKLRASCTDFKMAASTGNAGIEETNKFTEAFHDTRLSIQIQHHLENDLKQEQVDSPKHG